MVSVKKILNREDLDLARAVRRKVFVEEQHCLAELEWAHDEDSTHFLAFLDGQPCGAARWRETEKGYKLERFAVLKAYRGKGVGAALVQAVLNDLPANVKLRYLNAQTTAISLYSRFNFKPTGELFEEAGIMHQQMILEN